MRSSDLEHVLLEWLQQGDNTPVRRAITWGDLTETHRIADLVRTPNLVHGLKFLDPSDDSTVRDLDDTDKKNLVAALSFNNTLQNEFGPIRSVGLVEATGYSREQFIEYVDSGEYDPNKPTTYDMATAREGLKFRKEIGELKDGLPTTTITTTTSTSSDQRTESRATQEQLRNISKSLEKPDINAYIELVSDEQWYEFSKHFKATSNVQGVWFVLQDSYVATTEAEKQLLIKASNFLYTTMSAKLKTPTGKGLIALHFENMYAKAVWKGMKSHYEGPIMKSAVAKKTLHDLVTMQCPETGNFVKHIEEHDVRVRRYDANATTRLTSEQKYEHLSNFVQNIASLNDVDDQATLFAAATGQQINSDMRIQLIKNRALMATNKTLDPTGQVRHRAFVSRIGDTDVYSDKLGNVSAFAVEEGTYTAFVTRTREGTNTRDGTRIPTAVWRLLTDNDKKQWLRISTHGRRTILRSNNPIDDDIEQQDLPSALRDSTRQVNFASTVDSTNSTEAYTNDRITVGTANLSDSTQDNDTLFVNTIIGNAMQAAQKLPPRFHTSAGQKLPTSLGQKLHPLDPRSLMSDRHAQTGEQTGEQDEQSEGYGSYDDERIKGLYYPCKNTPGESEESETAEVEEETDMSNSKKKKQSPLSSAIRNRMFPRGQRRLKSSTPRTSRA